MPKPSKTRGINQWLKREDLILSGEKKVKGTILLLRQVEKKVNLVWHPDHTVSYQRKKFYYFEREMSVGPLEDTV